MTISQLKNNSAVDASIGGVLACLWLLVVMWFIQLFPGPLTIWRATGAIGCYLIVSLIRFWWFNRRWGRNIERWIREESEL